MKKIVLFLSAILVVSCSNQDENEVLNSSNMNAAAREQKIVITNEIDQMFFDYVNSESYMKMTQLSNSYLNKLKVNPSGLNFESETQMFSWLETNIHLTSFENLTEAKVKWQEFKHVVEIDVVSNKRVRDYIKSAPLNDVVFYIGKWQFSIVSSENECDKTFSQCVATATANYIAANVTSAMSGYYFGYALAQMTFTTDTNWCMHDFINCVDREN